MAINAEPNISGRWSTFGAVANIPGGSDAGAANAGVQPGNGIGGGKFVNERTALTPAPQKNFQNTAFAASDEKRIVGGVATAGSYTGTTTLAVSTKTQESSKQGANASTGGSAASTTPIVLAAAAACVAADAAVAVAKKRAESSLSTPRTPLDDTIYYQVEGVLKPGQFQVNRQLTPPV
ncbi:unnamed protein product [Phytophthora fragariaefolia]|uniref:Unnamed protein product n=1 Tax=Phytophthora fragariaefolia TaxID=1490495 RepID=A0A9W7CUS2_9STRA|nr:unnamed protein product [Phytophthora fragariaefolia]